MEQAPKQRRYFKENGTHMPHATNGVSMSIPKRLRKAKPTHGTQARSGRGLLRKKR